MSQPALSVADRAVGPLLRDLIGIRIVYIYSQPYLSVPVVTTGVIQDYKQVKHILYLEIQPDDPCLMTKWRSEVMFLTYAD